MRDSNPHCFATEQAILLVVRFIDEHCTEVHQVEQRDGKIAVFRLVEAHDATDNSGVFAFNRNIAPVFSVKAGLSSLP